MASLIGQRLGQYEIIALLGEGGMGTVYAARQPSMNRDVAIKVIRAELAKTHDFVRRFEREVQISATLSHPHILKVFDYGQQDDTVFVVMEFISGGSLADLVREGPLAPDVVARLLDQIASALDYAHELGIVHRDLKPQNVLVDPRGNAFLTDFGIAWIMSDPDAAEGATPVGTPAYMPPEEWEGIPPDARADIYSLGILLFEMLTGEKPFSGSTFTEMGQMHLYEPPPSAHQLKPQLPPEVDQVLAKALAKDRTLRFSSAGAMAIAFQGALSGRVPEWLPPESTATPGPQKPAPQLTAPLMHRSCSVLALNGLAVLALLGLLALVGFAVASSTNTPKPTLVAANTTPPADTRTLEVVTMAFATHAPAPTTEALQPTIQPTTPLPPTAVALEPTIQPTTPPAPTAAAGTDPEQLAFSSDRSEATNGVFLMNADGSTARRLTPGRANNYGPSWSPDGRFIAFSSNRDGNFEVYVMDSNGSNWRNLTNSSFDDFDPAWSPDRQHIAFVSWRTGNREILVMDADGQNVRNLTNNPATDWFPAWSPDGQHIAFTSDRDGNFEIYVMGADGRNPRNLSNHPADDRFTAWSPDGQRIAFNTNRDGNFEIYVMDIDGRNPRNLSNHPADDLFAAWSRNGQDIAFTSMRDGNQEIYVMDPDGQNVRNLTNSPGNDFYPSWQP